MESTSSLNNRGEASFKLDPRLIGLATAARADLLIAIALSGAAGLSVVGIAWQLTTAIEHVFLGGENLAQVLPSLLGMAGLAVLRAGCLWGAEAASSRLAATVKHSLRRQLLTHLFRLGPIFQRSQQRGELSNTLVTGVEQLDAYFSQFLPQAALALLLPLMLLGFIAPLDPLSALVLAVTAPLIPLFMILIGAAADRMTARQWARLSRLSAVLYDLLQGLKTLKALGRSRQQAERLDQAGRAYTRTTMEVLRLAFISALALEWLSTLSIAVIAVEIGLRLLAGDIHFQSALFILVLAPEFYLPLRTLGLRFHAAMDGIAAADRIFELLSIPARETSGTQRPPTSPPTIVIEGLGFQHSGRAQPTLQSIDLTLQPGQTTVLLGTTGAGKSTLIDILLGFQLPDQGAIRVGQKTLGELDLDLWRHQIAWVPQSPILFNAPVRDNLLCACPEASASDLAEALVFAGMDDVIKQMSDGLDTHLGIDGAGLSAGEVNRLMLARAFLQDAELVLLDEPTAHLDPTLERELLQRLGPWLRQRTALIATHRMSLLSICSQAVVLSHGTVLQCGPPRALIAQQGPLRRLMQAYGGQA